jgi:hypothetical protein
MRVDGENGLKFRVNVGVPLSAPSRRDPLEAGVESVDAFVCTVQPLTTAIVAAAVTTARPALKSLALVLVPITGFLSCPH